MSVLPVMNRRDGPFCESRSNARIAFNSGRDNPARDEWDAFEDLREADDDNYGNRGGYYARGSRFVADDERSQFTAEKGKKAGGYTPRYEAPKPVARHNSWSIITNKDRTSNDERISSDDISRSESREVSHAWSHDSEGIFGNDKSFEEPEKEPVAEVPLPFSYLQLQSQANDMFVHLDVTEGCIESKVDALITKNASYDSQAVQEAEVKAVETETELVNEVEEESTSHTETTSDEEVLLGPVENDVMKCERQIGSAYKKSMKNQFVQGQTLFKLHPNFTTLKNRRAAKKNKPRSINLTEEAPMVQICESEYGETFLEPMFFEPNFKELVQYKPFYDQESIDSLIVNDMLEIFQETSPAIITYEPKTPELLLEMEEIEELSEEELDKDDVTVDEHISVTQLSVAESSLGSSVGSSSTEGLTAIPEDEEYVRQMDSAIDDLLFMDAAQTMVNVGDKVEKTVILFEEGMSRTKRYLKSRVRHMRRNTKTFFKNLWKIQIIKPRPSLANVSGAAVFSKKFRELNPKKRELPLIVAQVDGYSDCSMSVSSHSYTEATPQRSRRNSKRNKFGRGIPSSYGSLSDASTISTRFPSGRSKGGYSNARTFRNTYVQDGVSKSSATSCASYISYSECSIQSGSVQSRSNYSSNHSESSGSWSTIN